MKEIQSFELSLKFNVLRHPAPFVLTSKSFQNVHILRKEFFPIDQCLATDENDPELSNLILLW